MSPKLIDAYYSRPTGPERLRRERVAFGTSGIAAPRSTALSMKRMSLRSARQLYRYRKKEGIDGPLFIGSIRMPCPWPALQSALEVLAGQRHRNHDFPRAAEYTPTPAVSLAILVHNPRSQVRISQTASSSRPRIIRPEQRRL